MDLGMLVVPFEQTFRYIYCKKLEYVQVVTNCRYSIAQMCMWEEYLPAF